ncbi:MAG: FAD:protein FMN transferase [Chthoniobacterales bacterium]
MSPCVEHRRARPLLGTFVEINARGTCAEEAVEAAFAEIEKVHRLMSFHDPASDVSHFNATPVGKKIRLHPWTHRVLRLAAQLSEDSGGVFDITVAPALAALGFLPPTPRHSGSWRDLHLHSDGTGMKTQPLTIDLGGIAKGFAVDVAVRKLMRFPGIAAGLVNAGGDLRAFGNEPWPVAIRHASDPGQRAAIIQLQNAAVATSAGYYRSRQHDGTRITALIHGISRQPLSADGSVSVIAPTAAVADALTKVIALGASPRILRKYRAQSYVQNRLAVA